MHAAKAAHLLARRPSRKDELRDPGVAELEHTGGHILGRADQAGADRAEEPNEAGPEPGHRPLLPGQIIGIADRGRIAPAHEFPLVLPPHAGRLRL